MYIAFLAIWFEKLKHLFSTIESTNVILIFKYLLRVLIEFIDKTESRDHGKRQISSGNNSLFQSQVKPNVKPAKVRPLR